jgi:hypothetical protein
MKFRPASLKNLKSDRVLESRQWQRQREFLAAPHLRVRILICEAFRAAFCAASAALDAGAAMANTPTGRVGTESDTSSSHPWGRLGLDDPSHWHHATLRRPRGRAELESGPGAPGVAMMMPSEPGCARPGMGQSARAVHTAPEAAAAGSRAAGWAPGECQWEAGMLAHGWTRK